MAERKGNLSEIAAEYLRNRIMKGELKQKEKIVEKEIAEQLGMSRGPVREALQQLQYEGFVDYESNKGCTVTLLSPKDAYEVFYLRGSMEKLALELCNGHILYDSLLIMEEALEDMRPCMDDSTVSKESVAADEVFHRQIVLCGRMNRLMKMWESLSPLNGAMFVTVRNMSALEEKIFLDQGRVPREKKSVYEMHKDLFDVLKKGDLEKSSAAIDQHYRNTGERILKVGMRMENYTLF